MRHLTRHKLILATAIALIIGILLGGLVAYTLAQAQNTLPKRIISAISPEITADVIVVNDTDTQYIYVIDKYGNLIYSSPWSDGDASDDIQKAIDYVESLGGGKILIMTGIYSIVKPISLGNNIILQGCGWKTRLIKDKKACEEGGYDSLVIEIIGEHNVLKDLYIESGTYREVGSGRNAIIMLYSSSNYTIIDHIFLKQRNDNDQTDAWVNGITVKGDNWVIKNCRLVGTGVKNIGMSAIYATNTRDTNKHGKILNNWIEGWGHNGIFNSPNYGIIAHNVFINNWDDAIDPNNNTHVIVMGNYFYFDPSFGEPTGSCVSLEYGCDHWQIVNNFVEGWFRSFVEIRGCNNVLTANNYIQSIWVQGKIFELGESDGDGASHVHIVGNYIASVPSQGVIQVCCSTSYLIHQRVSIIGNRIAWMGSDRKFIYIDGTNMPKLYMFDIRDNIFENPPPYFMYLSTGSVEFDNFVIEDNRSEEDGATTINFNVLISGIILRNNNFLKTENKGITYGLYDGAVIAHDLIGKPSRVILTCLNATYDGVPVIVSWDEQATNSTHIVVHVFWVNGTAITDPVIAVAWEAEI